MLTCVLCICAGVDPKSVLCAFFKAGMCKKGDKCKFSHDMNLARKGAKRSIYDDGTPKPDGRLIAFAVVIFFSENCEHFW